MTQLPFDISGEIPRVTSIDKETFEEQYVKKGRPVVITDLSNKWRAFDKWKDPDYLRDKVGHRQVPVYECDPENREAVRRFAGFLPVAGAVNRHTMALKTLLDRLEEMDPAQDGTHFKGRFYLADCTLSEFIPELLEDIDVPDLLEKPKAKAAISIPRVWIGRNNFSRTHMHVKNHDLLCQLVGQKRCLMFGPEQAPNLYPNPMWCRTDNPFNSQVNIEHPDYQQHPNFRNAKAYDCLLNPGDILYIPTFWWHAVYTPGLSMAVAIAHPSRPGWGWKYPKTGFRVGLAKSLSGVVSKLGWRKKIKSPQEQAV